MGLYIRPAKSVEENGVRITPFPKSWVIACAELRDDEHLAAVARRAHGDVALLIEREADFTHVQACGCELYIIDGDLARQVS